MRIDVNIEKMPIFFFGTEEKKKALEKKIASSNEPYEVSSVIDETGAIKKLSVAPNAIYGMLTEFDQDITTVVFYQLYDFTRKGGYCPRKIRIPFSDFPKIMQIKKQGVLYKNIERSAKRISNFEILQDKYITVKEKGGQLKIYEEKSLKLFYFKGIFKKEKETRSGKRTKKYYLELEIPEWVTNNIENFYTSEFDIKTYFTVKGGRTRKLYRFLEFIRYEKTKFISYKKLQTELWVEGKEKFRIKEALKRSFAPLVESGYLHTFAFNNIGVLVTFSSVKRQKKDIQLTLEDIARQDSLVLEMLDKLGDLKSKNFYYKVAQKVPEELIHKSLSLTREVLENRQIKISKGAVFTDILKRECKEIGVNFS